MNPLVYPVLVRGHKMWRLDYVENGRRKRRTFAAKAKAEDAQAEVKRGVATARSWWNELPKAEQHRLMSSLHDSSQQGHDPAELLSRSAEMKPRNGPTLSKVIEELETAKQNAGRSDDYKKTLIAILNKFASGRGSLKVDAVTVGDIETFLDNHSLASRSTIRARLSTLFKFAVRRGYRSDNPCARLEAITYTKPPPRIFTVPQFRKAVKWLKEKAPHGLAWFALSTACGLRPEEAEKTTKRDIHFKEGWIKVEAQTTKVRERRVVYPKPEAMAFLKWAIKAGGVLPLDPQARKRILKGATWKIKEGRTTTKGLRQALGFEQWPKDITRHTAASYWLADDGSAAHVSAMLGNSESVLKRDYKALATRAEAKEFWNLVRTIPTTYKQSHKMRK